MPALLVTTVKITHSSDPQLVFLAYVPPAGYSTYTITRSSVVPPAAASASPSPQSSTTAVVSFEEEEPVEAKAAAAQRDDIVISADGSLEARFDLNGELQTATHALLLSRLTLRGTSSSDGHDEVKAAPIREPAAPQLLPLMTGVLRPSQGSSASRTIPLGCPCLSVWTCCGTTSPPATRSQAPDRRARRTDGQT